MHVAQLIDRGIKAYVAGRVGEALRSFQEVLEIDPGNPKARSYLLLIHGGAFADPPPPRPDPASAPRPPAPPPAPAPAASQPGASPWDAGPAATVIEIEEDGGLDLEAVSEKTELQPLVPERPPPRAAERARSDQREVEVWLQAARELFQLGDFSGSLELIEKILKVDPDHREARAYLRQNEATLIAMYESKLGPLSGVPRLAIQPEEIMWLNLDHRAGFLLAQIDGVVDYDSLFALSGLPRLDTARILANLIADGVITS